MWWKFIRVPGCPMRRRVLPNRLWGFPKDRLNLTGRVEELNSRSDHGFW